MIPQSGFVVATGQKQSTVGDIYFLGHFLCEHCPLGDQKLADKTHMLKSSVYVIVLYKSPLHKSHLYKVI